MRFHIPIQQRLNIIGMGAYLQTDSIISQKLILELFTYLLNQK
ncbi:hypothetical protein [Anabaena azotica]|nr:hypothetical protein [Anabaena azotica]